MPDLDTTRESGQRSASRYAGHAGTSRRIVTWRAVGLILILLAIILMAVLPPLLNVNRFKRRIVTSISTSIGRPVHLDSVSLILLPLPGFKLENFVVAEDPAFGSEPVIHANSVLATLRFSSLWRRRLEFSRISLQEPSINLVHTPPPGPDGHWNVESILLQAARIPAAPTAQVKPSAVPRFPYIEATGARVNVKSGLEKLPFSLTDADFALWLPNPQQWRVRLVARPTRTDTNASDTGTISLEGSLGHAESFEAIPLELSAEWKNAPLGEASRVLTGRDAGLRGELLIGVTATGTVGDSRLKTTLDLRGARRADFVPLHPLDLHAECQATSAATFHAFHQVRCAWPPPLNPALIAVTGDIPDIAHLASASFEIGTPGLSAAMLLDWLRIASSRVPAGLVATGTLAGSVSVSESGAAGSFNLKGAALTGGPLETASVEVGDLAVSSGTLGPAPASRRPRLALQEPASPDAKLSSENAFLISPTALTWPGKESALLDGGLSRTGYTLHLAGNVLPSHLLAFAAAFPQAGDGLQALIAPPAPSLLTAATPRPEAFISFDVTSTGPWLGRRTWSNSVAPPVTKTTRHRLR